MRQRLRWFIPALIGAALILIAAACRETGELGETAWELVAYGPADAPLLAEVPASIRFEDNGRMGGHTGCNAFSTHYAVDGGRLIFPDNEIAFTTQDCDPTTPEGRQDAFFRQWLVQGIAYTQTAEELVLYFDEGRQIAEYKPGEE